MKYYNESIDVVLTELNTSEAGLTDEEVLIRRDSFGRNELQTKTGVHPLLIFISQFKSFIIYILLFAVSVSLLIEEYVDAIIILIILLTNAFIGFFQELSAGRSLEALKKLTSIKARALRDGKTEDLDSGDLVPGDIMFLEAGDKVPADARIIDAVRLKVEEASLTGESVPVDKHTAPVEGDVQIGARYNMLFSSTTIVAGHASAVVTATGMQTEIGRITALIKEAGEEMTPLQRRLDRFGKKLGYAILCICFFIFAASFLSVYIAEGTVSGNALIAFAFIAISLAVAAVPTALPAVVTIALSVGVKRLLKQRALVRKLSSVETLGSCDVICTDKTGTLTENRMTVRRVWTMDGSAEITDDGNVIETDPSNPVDPLLFQIGAVCNNARLIRSDDGWTLSGDPTEAALLASAERAGWLVETDRIDELPFDSERKLMSVLISDETGMKVYTKGAPDQVLKRCTHILIGGKIVVLSDEQRQHVLLENDASAKQAMRVLGFAFKNIHRPEEFVEENLIFTGLQAMVDPPRPDVIDSIRKTGNAGIRTIMITGDYRETAMAIGAAIGISGQVLTGEELDRMDDEMLGAALNKDTNIFARVAPEHKQRIVQALQDSGHTVAMTGDGVNDAPALKKADIGVAVGSGTDVAKEAADFVILDDSFSNIVNAIEEGRGIYDNIQKSIMLLLSGNLGEVLIIFLAVMLGFNLPLTAVLLLWINMVTDGAPALAYSVDPYGRDLMIRPPKPANEGILPLPHLTLIGVLGVAGTVIALFLFYLYNGQSDTESDVQLGRTMVFNFVVLYELILVFAIRTGYRVPVFANRWIWFSVILSIGLQALLLYTPLHTFFKITPLSLPDIAALSIAGFVFFCAFLAYHYGLAPALFKRKNG